MSKKRKILILTHPSFVPDPGQKNEDSATEAAIETALLSSGHEVRFLGLADNIHALRTESFHFAPDIAFNLTEEFAGIAEWDQNVVGYLELLGIPYTGCHPQGLVIARNKAIAKTLCKSQGLNTPKFAVIPQNSTSRTLIKALQFPLIVKSLSEEASLGISQSSVVYSASELEARLEHVHQNVGTDALVEEYIDGRELYVGVIGNRALLSLPAREMDFGDLGDKSHRFATRRVKWNAEYRKKHGISSHLAKLSSSLEQKIRLVSLEVYRTLGLSGYARLDFRLSAEGELYFLEANPNPHLGPEEDFAESAAQAGMDYPKLLGKILTLGMNRKS